MLDLKLKPHIFTDKEFSKAWKMKDKFSINPDFPVVLINTIYTQKQHLLFLN